jgi:hypothetical protein
LTIACLSWIYKSAKKLGRRDGTWDLHPRPTIYLSIRLARA